MNYAQGAYKLGIAISEDGDGFDHGTRPWVPFHSIPGGPGWNVYGGKNYSLEPLFSATFTGEAGRKLTQQVR